MKSPQKFSSHRRNTRICDGCVDQVTTRHCNPLTTTHCVATTECCPNTNISHAAGINCADFARLTIRVALAVCKARTWRAAIYAESGVCAGACADASAAGATRSKRATGLAAAAWVNACPIRAHARGTLAWEISIFKIFLCVMLTILVDKYLPSSRRLRSCLGHC